MKKEKSLQGKIKLKYSIKENISTITPMFIGFVLLLISTYWFTYLIPNIDSEIQSLDETIKQGEFNYYQFQLTEAMCFIPYNLKKTIDISSDTYIELQEEEAKVKRVGIMALYWPNVPTQEELDIIKDKNVNILEDIKRQLFPKFTASNNFFVNQKQEKMNQKQSKVYTAVIIQILGLIISQMGVLIQVLKNKK